MLNAYQRMYKLFLDWDINEIWHETENGLNIIILIYFIILRYGIFIWILNQRQIDSILIILASYHTTTVSTPKVMSKSFFLFQLCISGAVHNVISSVPSWYIEK